MDCSLRGSSIHGISQVRNWIGSPFAFPEDLSRPGIEPVRVAPALGPQWLRGEESACNAGDPGSTPGLGYSLEEGMTPDSSVFAWRSPWSGEPGGALESW